jgi:glutathione peroxidase
MAKFRGKVVMLVNTASFCGFTPQYEGLQKIQTDYAAKGFTVLGVPSGNFKEQEYGSNKDISEFCKAKFGIKFPLAEKSDVVGAKAIPLYRWAAAKLGPDNTPRWNFHKYLIGRDGRLIAAFGTRTDPGDPKIRAAIEAALKASPGKA